ncbi:GHMP kinase [Tenacibaculum finnmarkense genomovar finnmarkense]|uniref:GYDIA family GHMP kinase n=1 Tax=Tenacibaculum finnmarkense TaxID=2781243 RepID=UPI001EFBC6C4|nr:GYDIA family GHMP kinase [Tenacibaculum finnmarkense]MCG8211805.1 GHMP kinase [Tenacibaculum finnmarkense genomovar finnmarkense]MCG8229990.1 GHMP kinase [Tenacibaculum finnmarkense genomovar finnmarkense]MCG8240298.1 GHMP kinase [Tenacibaculum finnmarkense genomovar finnmarkense]MCG8716923.1 GHMP kinase [Tenacibaculum finnmarkense]MCG8724533.1 GHMP kinase [Tenacibaculum finnmarkense]
MDTFYSNGKLLLTGEYLILDGATSLAVPTKFGQDLTVEPIKEQQLIWESFTNTGECWFEATFDLPKLRLTSATFNSDKEGNAEFIAETLSDILQEAKKLNPDFLSDKNDDKNGYLVKTNLTFPQNWGLGSSSTLINNIATWAKVNPFILLQNAFSGSGYDIACASNNTPILYQLDAKKPIVSKVEFNPNFTDELFFIYLNQKQNSREGIAQYKNHREEAKKLIPEINNLTQQFLKADSTKNINKIIVEHEQIISSIIKQTPVKKRLFPDYFGEIKSLGAWGGDFVLATGNENTVNYFEEKGYNTIVPYQKMVL